jgi:hypothetical protein
VVAFNAQIRDLLGDHAQNPNAHDHAHLFLENPFEILIPGLLRGHFEVIHHFSVGWFKRLFKQAVSVHRPINQHYFFLTI